MAPGKRSSIPAQDWKSIQLDAINLIFPEKKGLYFEI